MVRSGVMELNFDDIWVKVQELLKPALNPVSFNTWFQDPKIHNITEDKVTLIVPMHMYKRMFESTYKELLNNSFAEILGEEKAIECVLEDEIKDNTEKLINDVVNNLLYSITKQGTSL